MDVLDEKANGNPPMEVEEIVSVNDREYAYCADWRTRAKAIATTW